MVNIFSVAIFLCWLLAARSIEMELFPGDMRVRCSSSHREQLRMGVGVDV